MLVVAANEGPKPQTIEHLAILQYLNVKRAIVVLTKRDTVDAEELGFAEELVRDAIAGTFASDAPFVAVSATTGAGMDALRDAIHAALVSLPPRAPDAPVYLPIDRVFALPGHGTIVTGTLMQGRLAVGDQLALAPGGRDVRVRSLQVFGSKRDRVEGGARVAVNLPGIERADIARGGVLASPQFATHATLDVVFRPLPAAVPILRRRNPVRAYLGAAEILGTLVFSAIPNDAEAIAARLHLREATIALPGAAFVVRRLSPKTLLGGGTIAATGDARLSGDDVSPGEAALLAALRAAGLAGADAARLGAAANVRDDAASAILTRFVDDGRAVRIQKPAAFVDAASVDALVARVTAWLGEREAATPWVVGATTIALARAVDVAEANLARVLAVAADDGRLAYRAGYYATPAFVPALEHEQRAFFDRMFAVDATQPMAPVAADDVATALRSAKIVGLAQAYETLLASGALVKVHDAVYRGPQLAEIREKLESTLRREKQLTMAAFRDLIGTSRKYAVPLLEWFDATGVTIRAGDVRYLKVGR